MALSVVLSLLTVIRPGAVSADGNESPTATSAARAISAGENHTCAILSNGSVRCWGLNQVGQLGLGDTEDRGDEPGEMGAALPAVDLGTGRTAKAITTGQFFSCALLDNGTVRCWGDNSYGQLGTGGTGDRGDESGEMGNVLPTVNFGPGRTAVAIAAGEQHACAILDNGSLKCWGDNLRGQLGYGDVIDRGGSPSDMGAALPAVDLGTGRTARAVSAGRLHTCAILDDGSLKCWGDNPVGNLGQGDTVDRGDGPDEMGDDLPAIDLGTDRTARPSPSASTSRVLCSTTRPSSAGATTMTASSAKGTRRHEATNRARWVTICRPSRSAQVATSLRSPPATTTCVRSSTRSP